MSLSEIPDVNRPADESPHAVPAPSPELSFVERRRIPAVLFVFLTLLIIGIVYQGIGYVLTTLFVGDVPTERTIEVFRYINGGAEILLLLIPTILATLLVTRSPKAFLQLRVPSMKVILVSLVGIFSLEQMLQVYSVFQDKLENMIPEPVRTSVLEVHKVIDDLTRMIVTPRSTNEFFWVIIIVALIPAISEELLFRGFVQRSFQREMKPLQSAVLAGIIFAGFHLNPFSFIPLAGLGIFLGFIAMRSGSIVTSMTAHFFNNFIACLAVYFDKKDDYVITGNANEMSPGALMLTFWLFGIVFFVATYYFLHITRTPSGTTDFPHQTPPET
jgi:membrane protease YdiL (CAAX protease family)